MSRTEDWRQEANEALKREGWSLFGASRIVKVMPLPLGGTQALSASGQSALGGYFTVAKALFGKTPLQIEQQLGLPYRYLANGARIYRFIRLPMAHEYEYELTAQDPGGLAYNPAHGDPAYTPGSGKIHQWRLKDGVQIPVDANNVIDLLPGQPFLYSM